MFLRLSANCISREVGAIEVHFRFPSRIAYLWAFWTPLNFASQFILTRSYWSCVSVPSVERECLMVGQSSQRNCSGIQQRRYRGLSAVLQPGLFPCPVDISRLTDCQISGRLETAKKAQ